MPEVWIFVVLGFVTFLAASLASVTGFGSAAILLPVLIYFFDAREGVAILTVVQLIGNLSRVWFNRKEIQWSVVKKFAIGAIPATLLGGMIFAVAPLPILSRFLGVFLLLIVVGRRLVRGKSIKMKLEWFTPLGFISSFLSAIVGTVGPLVAPFFLAFGLAKGAYISTEAISSVLVQLCKLFIYGTTNTLSMHALLVGTTLTPALILGALVGKKLLDKISEDVFRRIIEIVLIVAGSLMILGQL